MTLKRQDLEDISARTLDHYDRGAEDFWKGTQDHDVSQNIAALLRHINGEPPFAILDFGCGPGRDLKTFAALGHSAIGLEGAAGFAAMARADTGCEVWLQDFHRLDLPSERFDGVAQGVNKQNRPQPDIPHTRILLSNTRTRRRT